MKRSLKILHAADFHLDSPYEALSAEKAALRRAEQRSLLHALAEKAAAFGADIVLLAGDLLDGEGVYRETGEALRAALGGISAPVFIAPGNHDFYGPHSVYARCALPENVHVFTGETVECVPLPELGARVWGAGFVSPGAGPLLRGFEAEKDGDTLDIMVLHGDALSRDSAYDPVSEADISRSGMDYIALGHIHSFSSLRRAGDTFYAWPGCPEGRGFDETGEKGVILAELSGGGCRAELVPLGTRRYEILEVELSNAADALSAALSALPDNTSRDIYRIIFTGECDGAPELRAVSAALKDRFFELQLRDATRPRRELWAKCGEDTLRGLFLTKLRGMYDAEQDETRRGVIALAARYGLAALDNGEGPEL